MTTAIVSSQTIAGLACDRIENDAPALILVHGGFCDRRDWEGIIKLLSSRFDLIAPDLPGHGETPQGTASGFLDLAQALTNVRATLAKPIVLVGHSLGCFVALESVARTPYGVAGLVLIEGGMNTSGDPGRSAAALERKIDEVSIAGLLSRASAAWSSPASPPTLRDHIAQRLDRLDPGFARTLLIDAARWEEAKCETALAACDLPLLLVQSTDTAGVQRRSLEAGETTAWIESVRCGAERAEVRVLPGLGHFPHVEAPGGVAASILTFADAVFIASGRSAA